MPQPADIEHRLANLEGEVEQLKRRLSTSRGPEKWHLRVFGSFRDEPEFDEVLRLGREIRQQSE